VSHSHSVTDFLNGGGQAAPGAATDTLVRRIAEELRKIALGKAAGAAGGPEVEDCVQEAFRRLVLGPARAYADRKHFYRSAAKAIRRLRIDAARRRQAAHLGSRVRKSDPGQPRPEAGLAGAEQLLRLHQALLRLEESDPQAAALLEVLYFGVRAPAEAAAAPAAGPAAPLSVTEGGDLLGLSRATAYRAHKRGLARLREILDDATEARP
jgi:RNA polymerase sigma factor (sigma-70 family)